MLALAVPANGGQIEDGLAAANRGDFATALRLWRPLAEQGVAGAQQNLGFMYDYGEGVPQDYAEAVKWYRRAAEQGDDEAQFNLGVLYEIGDSVPQDDVQAYVWFKLAAALGHQSKPHGGVVAARNRDRIARRMTPDQIAEAQRMAREWRAKHQR